MAALLVEVVLLTRPSREGLLHRLRRRRGKVVHPGARGGEGVSVFLTRPRIRWSLPIRLPVLCCDAFEEIAHVLEEDCVRDEFCFCIVRCHSLVCKRGSRRRASIFVTCMVWHGVTQHYVP